MSRNVPSLGRYLFLSVLLPLVLLIGATAQQAAGQGSGTRIAPAPAEGSNSKAPATAPMTESKESAASETAPIEKVMKTQLQWQQELTKDEFYVTRIKGTERAFSSPLHDNEQPGVYRCTCCDLPLFDAEAKFETDTGWPSFFQPINSRNVTDIVYGKAGKERTEIICSRCESHLGHVFSDGPAPTGLRYCANGVSLKFEPPQPADASSEAMQDGSGDPATNLEGSMQKTR